MARSLLRSLLIAAAVPLGATVAMAQFNPFSAIFGNPPPRPQNNVPGPSSVPGGRQQMGTPAPTQPAAGYPGGSVGAVQSRPLPAPGGANQDQPPLAALPPGQRQPRPVVPFDPSTPPGDDVIAEPPAQKITNGAAQFAGLDKITGRITSFDVTVGETVQFGALQLTPRACYTRPPTETANTDAFIEIDEVTLQGEVRRIFNGWMFAASPGLNAVEHPIYDVWLTDCKRPVVAAIPPPEPTPPAATTPRTPSQRTTPQQPQQQPQRRQQPAAAAQPPPQQQQQFFPFGR
jgi:hypothetical protein